MENKSKRSNKEATTSDARVIGDIRKSAFEKREEMLLLREQNRVLDAENERLRKHIDELQNLIRKDALTMLGNNESYREDIAKMIALHIREWKAHAARPLSLVVIDGDGLKLINDTYGHEAGDEAIRELAGGISNTIRSSDLAYRRGKGADEFVIILEDADSAAAKTFIGRLYENFKIRFSAGSASLFEDVIAESPSSMSAEMLENMGSTSEQRHIGDALFNEAERRMYIAKDLRKKGAE